MSPTESSEFARFPVDLELLVPVPESATPVPKSPVLAAPEDTLSTAGTSTSPGSSSPLSPGFAFVETLAPSISAPHCLLALMAVRLFLLGPVLDGSRGSLQILYPVFDGLLDVL